MLSYQETLQAIHSHKANGRRPDFKRLNWILDKLGRPQAGFPSLHIVGTNGKGSTTALLQAIFTTAGYKTGTFTSPFITRFNERIAIDGQPISDKELVEVFDLVKPWLDQVAETEFGSLTEFELVTVLAFLYFERIQPVDIAIIEAGIGGRFDSTNVINPLATICTSIGYDHTDTLGERLADIAWQKAGANKPAKPIVLGQVPLEAQTVFENEAKKLGAALYQAGCDFQVKDREDSFDFMSPQGNLENLSLSLMGPHQRDNAALALETALLLQAVFPKLDEEAFRIGLQTATWPGRGELVRPNILLDGAHNPQGIGALLELLETDFPNSSKHFLFAGLKRKDLAGMLELLDGQDLTITSFDFPGAAELADYPDYFKKIEDFRDWLSQTQDSQALYVVTGSLYFISQVRHFLLDKETP
ncbi:bifunctional folylpolyglutamate synthase/dihydrofolate synthase [Streptococcus sobrinus]|uniref:bifunctional folylpolyglutamate synthase/dihydrofolate synthase n=1 Tax=Streptococcus sobrinus TaxID=1310 RepID=UPI0002E84B8B|nr:folylpolyglutamate synthase/dihydrofolate synthase family protein [Streptococcus sobrinus]OZV23502.1 bifunctional folylpolyglutamate synthase/dihydrofolate synthase [Streptococcus sobrinus]